VEMNNPGNVKEIAELNPDILGFIFYPGSPRYVGNDPDLVLFNSIPPGIKKTGDVFYNEDNHKILDLSDPYRSGYDSIAWE